MTYDNLAGTHLYLKGGEVRTVTFASDVDTSTAKDDASIQALMLTVGRAKFEITYVFPAEKADA